MSLLGKILMKDGCWLVPPEERPSGWERYALREPAVSVAQDPTEEEVAGAVADAAEQMRHDKLVDNASDKPSQENPQVNKSKRDISGERRTFDKICRSIKASADNYGADNVLRKYARLMAAGMWSGRSLQLSEWSGLTEEEVGSASLRFIRAGIWSIEELRDGYLVHMGDESDSSDLGFWLNVMVGAGEIEGKISETGEILYAAKGFCEMVQART